MVVDDRCGILYAGQEAVGVGGSRSIVTASDARSGRTREFGVPSVLVEEEDDPGDFDCEYVFDADRASAAATCLRTWRG